MNSGKVFIRSRLAWLAWYPLRGCRCSFWIALSGRRFDSFVALAGGPLYLRLGPGSPQT